MLTIQNNYVKRFDELDELVDYCKDEHENVYYLPNDGDTFYFAEDDRIHSVGNTLPHEGCTFTEPGIKAVFTKMGVPGLFPCMMAPNEKDVATKYLNKLLYDSSIQRNLSNQQFIVDSRKPNNPIVGMVSKTYLKYSNHSFLDHFLNYKTNNNDGLEFTRAFVDNTKMTIKWSEKDFSGIMIDGRPDRVKLGLYSGNSMIGNATLYFLLSVLDALCTNGTMLPKSLGGSRIVHKGDRIWSGEIENMVNDTRKSYDRAIKQIETTLNIPFNTDTAKIMLENDAPIDIPRDSRVPHKYWTTKRNFAKKEDSTKALEHSLNFVKAIPSTFGGVHTQKIFNSNYRKGNTSMYHFIGAFTEYAQQQPVREQYRIEEEAGELVNWFNKNTSKFIN